MLVYANIILIMLLLGHLTLLFLTVSQTVSWVLWHIAYCFQAFCVSSFPPQCYPSISILFLLLSVYNLCLWICVSACVSSCVHTSFTGLCSCNAVLSVWFAASTKKRVEMISRAQTSNTRGRLSYGASIDCKNKGQRWLRGWKSWKKEIDEADRRQAGLQWIQFGVRRLWGLCQSGSGGKVAPLRERVESERERHARGCVGH